MKERLDNHKLPDTYSTIDEIRSLYTSSPDWEWLEVLLKRIDVLEDEACRTQAKHLILIKTASLFILAYGLVKLVYMVNRYIG